MDTEKGRPVSPRPAPSPHISYADRSAAVRIRVHNVKRRRRLSRELDRICRGDRWNY